MDIQIKLPAIIKYHFYAHDFPTHFQRELNNLSNSDIKFEKIGVVNSHYITIFYTEKDNEFKKLKKETLEKLKDI